MLLRWTDGEDQYEEGKCANICQGGMFVIAAKTLPHGSRVEVEFVLPPFGSVSCSTRMRCVGRVVRVQVSDPLKGFAIAGAFMIQGPEKGANGLPDEGL